MKKVLLLLTLICSNCFAGDVLYRNAFCATYAYDYNLNDYANGSQFRIDEMIPNKQKIVEFNNDVLTDRTGSDLSRKAYKVKIRTTKKLFKYLVEFEVEDIYGETVQKITKNFSRSKVNNNKAVFNTEFTLPYFETFEVRDIVYSNLVIKHINTNKLKIRCSIRLRTKPSSRRNRGRGITWT
jgi:hypothetical protein